MEPGTVTAALLLLRVTVAPPVGAAALNVAAHTSVPTPVIVEVLHVRPPRAAAPTP
jgi:hypothetical protein